jgi:hypothetical protein
MESIAQYPPSVRFHAPASLSHNKSPELVELDPGKGFRSCGAENSYSSARNREPSMLGSPGRLLITTLTELSRLIIAYLPTYILTPWSRVLLEKPTGFQLVKKSPAFYGTRRFITAVTSARHLSVSWASSIRSIPKHCVIMCICYTVGILRLLRQVVLQRDERLLCLAEVVELLFRRLHQSISYICDPVTVWPLRCGRLFVRVMIRSWDSAWGTKGVGALFIETRTAVCDVMKRRLASWY